MSNADFVKAGYAAIQAHKDWVIGLRKSIDTEKLHVETNPKRCRFGVFLSLVDKPDAVPNDLWNSALQSHEKLHAYGHEVDHYLQRGDIQGANRVYQQAENHSKTLVKMLQQIIGHCEKGNTGATLHLNG